MIVEKEYVCRNCGQSVKDEGVEPPKSGCPETWHSWYQSTFEWDTKWTCKKCGIVIKRLSTAGRPGLSDCETGEHEWIKESF